MHPLSAEGAKYGSALPDVTGADPTGIGFRARVRTLSGEQKKKKKEKKQREEVPDLREEARTGQEVEYAPRRKNGGRRGGIRDGEEGLGRLPPFGPSSSTGSFHHVEATALEGVVIPEE